MTRNTSDVWVCLLTTASTLLWACGSEPPSSSQPMAASPMMATADAPAPTTGAKPAQRSGAAGAAPVTAANAAGGPTAGAAPTAPTAPTAGAAPTAPTAGSVAAPTAPTAGSVAGMMAVDSGVPVDSGTAVACEPSDPPQVINFVATEYANFEVGAINFEPDAVTGMDTPNTGPYEPVIEVYPTFDQFTIYRPAQMEKPLQVIAWGNGGCAKHGTLHGDFLKELASYGYLIIADGAPGEKDNRGFGGPMSPMDATQQKLMLDWAFAENERPCSPFYQKLDLKHVAVAGNSCGGLMTMYAAPDPRIATAVLFNSGLFAREPMVYDALHAPMAIFNGGPEDFAGANGELDFEAINNIPIFLSNDTRGHGSYLWDDNAGETGPVAVAWFNWMLRGDEGTAGKGMFVGDNCGMCMKPDVWIDMKWKNLDKLP